LAEIALSPIFTADVQALLGDEKYAASCSGIWSVIPMRTTLLLAPAVYERFDGRRSDAASVVRTRMIYYQVVGQAQVRMILVYRKGIKDNLTPREKALLRKICAKWYRWTRNSMG